MPNAPGELRLSRGIQESDEEEPRREQVMLVGETVQSAIGEFGLAKADLVLGGTFVDLPYAQHAKVPGAALRFDRMRKSGPVRRGLPNRARTFSSMTVFRSMTAFRR